MRYYYSVSLPKPVAEEAEGHSASDSRNRTGGYNLLYKFVYSCWMSGSTVADARFN